jgi:YD repeat-containing protein
VRRSLLLLAVMSLCSVSLRAQLRGPDLEKGISPEKTYDYGGLDAINLFNGSLTVPIPLGPSYGVGPLSYRFTLTYTGNNWQLETNTFWVQDGGIPGGWRQQSQNHYEPFGSVRPDGSVDVGLGWQLTLGRESTGLTVGASEPGHLLQSTLFNPHHSVDPNPAVGYTNDGSFQRRRNGVPCGPDVAAADMPCHEIDFPDGSVHKYDVRDQLLEMRGPLPSDSTGAHPYVVTVTRGTDVVTNRPKLTVTDTYGRTHTFVTQRMTSVGATKEAEPLPDSSLGNFNQPAHYDVLTEARLAAFDLPGGANRENEVAVYSFSYADGDSGHSGLDATPISRRTAPNQDCLVPVHALVPLLERVTQPDLLDYAMEYDRGVAGKWSTAEPLTSVQVCDAEVQGYSSNLTALKLPTGGSFAWQYRRWDFPSGYNGARCPSDTGVEGPCGRVDMDSVGVGTRSALEADGTLLSKRTYSSAFHSLPGVAKSNHTQITTVQEYAKNSSGTWLPAFTTLNYYSVGTHWVVDGIVPEEYGLPFTRFTDSDPVESRRVPHLDTNGPQNGPGQRFLTSKTVDAAGTLKRYSYVAYEGDQPTAGTTSNRRVVGESTYDAETETYVATERDDYDGLGHYRTTTTKSNVPSTPDKATRVDYDGISGVGGTFATRYDPPFPLPAWVTSPFKSTTTWQGAAGGPSIHAEYCFDKHLLLRKRLRRSLDGSQSGNDVLIVYDYDSRGNVVSEEYYGGDLRDGDNSPQVETGPLCTLATLGTLDYQVNYTHVDPDLSRWTATSAYQDIGFKTTDVTVDPNTGLVTQSRDSAGVVTNYTYDRMGRLTRISPTGRAAAVYTYPTPSNMTLEVKREGTTAEPMPRSVYTFDGLGRLVTETESMPANTASVRTTAYDSLGRRASVSELGNAQAKTEFQYDIFGRTLSTKMPDGSLTTWAYEGNWKTTRTNTIWTGTANTNVSTIEEYDGHGRLVAVTEPSGATSATNRIGSSIRTEYTYGPGDQLLKVTMNVGGVPQQRDFDYDGRGFLRWESQPESGATIYRYDARGHVLTKRGDSPSGFDLDYHYDGAERLLSIKGRDPATGLADSRPLKEFEHGTANSGTDLRLGKLTLARRYNYAPGLPTYVIADAYEYKDAPGRQTGRTTTIARPGRLSPLKTVTTSMSYTELDLPALINYPMARSAGFPTAPDEVDRSGMTHTYDRGRLTSLSGFTKTAQKITYWPNGMRHELPHANGVIDMQKVGLMSRPMEIGFQTYGARCVAAQFVTQPENAISPAPGTAVTLEAEVTGTLPISYRVEDADGVAIVNGTLPQGSATMTITKAVSPQVTTNYFVMVENDCGTLKSQSVTVTVNEPCTPPMVVKIEPVRQADGSFILTPTFTAAEGRAFAWRKGTSSTVIGTAATYQVVGLTETATFHLTVTDDCGEATNSVTITILKPMPPGGLVATLNAAQTQVSLTWPAVSGAATYVVERRSGSEWEPFAQPAVNSFVDTNVQAGRTYAYRVQASNRTGYTTTDLATTGTFTTAAAAQVITAGHASSMLAALNSIRAAAGLTALTWRMMLPGTQPEAVVTKPITRAQMHALRSRINEARQALGASSRAWTDPDLTGVLVKAIHSQEIVLGAQ